MLNNVVTLEKTLELVEKTKEKIASEQVGLRFFTKPSLNTFRNHIVVASSPELARPLLVDEFKSVVEEHWSGNKFARIFQLTPSSKRGNCISQIRGTIFMLLRRLKYPASQLEITVTSDGERNRTILYYQYIGFPGMVELMQFQNDWANMEHEEMNQTLRQMSEEDMLRRSGRL